MHQAWFDSTMEQFNYFSDAWPLGICCSLRLLLFPYIEYINCWWSGKLWYWLINPTNPHFQHPKHLSNPLEKTCCQTSSIRHTYTRQWNCLSLRCSWSVVCRCCCNCIFILDLTPGFNRLHKDNCKMRWETFKFGDLVHLILETWQ